MSILREKGNLLFSFVYSPLYSHVSLHVRTPICPYPSSDCYVYLLDATIRALLGGRFNVKGKNVSKGFSLKVSGSSELTFKSQTIVDALTWHEVIKSASGASSSEPYNSNLTPPISPVDTKRSSPIHSDEKQPARLQTSGVTGGETVSNPTQATPFSPSHQHQSTGLPATTGTGSSTTPALATDGKSAFVAQEKA